MFRFQKVDISNAGPFREKQSLCFPEGTVIIAGDHGTGKTTLVKALRREFQINHLLVPGNQPNILPAWLMFFDDDILLPCGGQAWEPLQLFFQTHPQLWGQKQNLEAAITKHVRHLLSAKLNSANQLRVNLSENGVINVSDDTRSFNSYFLASGERIVLYLSINAAIRQLLFLDIPFVVDGKFYNLDTCLLNSCFTFALSMSNQTIILENCLFIGSLGLEPNFLILPKQLGLCRKITS